LQNVETVTVSHNDYTVLYVVIVGLEHEVLIYLSFHYRCHTHRQDTLVTHTDVYD